MTTPTRPLLGILIAILLWGATTHAEPSHGLALYGPDDLKYGPDEPYAFANPDAPKGGTVRLSTVGAFTKLNRFSLKGISPPSIGLVFESLMESSLDSEESFSPYGRLAETADIAPDRMSITYVLRSKARFSDGQPVTADDVVFSFNIIHDPDTALFCGDDNETFGEGDPVGKPVGFVRGDFHGGRRVADVKHVHAAVDVADEGVPLTDRHRQRARRRSSRTEVPRVERIGHIDHPEPFVRGWEIDIPVRQDRIDDSTNEEFVDGGEGPRVGGIADVHGAGPTVAKRDEEIAIDHQRTDPMNQLDDTDGLGGIRDGFRLTHTHN